ncbi:MAG: hypothetical protein AAGE43_16960 [Pseudomonadota bacterium]
MTNIIGTDHPLTAAQRDALNALLDTLIPPSDDGQMPGAGTQDLDAFLDNPTVTGFEQTVCTMLDALGTDFATVSPAEREARVSGYQGTSPESFNEVYLQTLAMYYRRPEVLQGIGSGEGPPFPRGNEVADGDLSLLDPVLRDPKVYRPT